VQREELVVPVGREQLHVRRHQLQPHDQRQQSPQQQEHEGGDDEAQADRPVIHGAQPADDARRCLPRLVELRDIVIARWVRIVLLARRVAIGACMVRRRGRHRWLDR
jgi:hypothetical protein